MNKAFFIDRDGIINKLVRQSDGYNDSPQSKEQVVINDGIVELLRWLHAKDIPVIEISNQPGVARGKMNMEQLNSIEEQIHSLLAREDVHIDKIYRCFHHPNATIEALRLDCDCRKPKGGLLTQAAKELSLDLSQSIFLGDNLTDVEAGFSAGCHTILFPHTPHPNDTKERLAKHAGYQAAHKIQSLDEVIPLLEKVFMW